MTLPSFSHDIVKELYTHELDIDRTVLQQILDNGPAIIPDLELVLNDIIQNSDDYLEPDDYNWSLPVHALYLLAELRAEQSFPLVLKIFSQEEDFIEAWFGDLITEDLWEVIYKIGQNHLNEIERFLKDQSIWIFSRTAVSNGLSQMAVHHSERKDEIIDRYKRIIAEIIPFVQKRGTESRNIWDTDDIDIAKEIIGFYVCDLMDIGDTSIKPYLYNLFDQGVVETAVVGQKDLDKATLWLDRKPIKNIFEKYSKWKHWYQTQKEPVELKVVQVAPKSKIGRNDPCPCGSGKKYKKCCLRY